MGKSMPKSALHGSHPKHPLYPLYASRKLLNQQLRHTKRCLENLYMNDTDLYEAVRLHFDWYNHSQRVRPKDYRDLLIDANDCILSQHMSTFVALRCLQKEVNNIRKVVQEKGVEDVDVKTTSTFRQNLKYFGRLIIDDLWVAHSPRNTKQATTLFNFLEASSKSRDANLIKEYEALHNDELISCLWRLHCSLCFHQQDDAFLDLVHNLLDTKACAKRFEPQYLAACLLRIELFHHLADTADLLLMDQGCFSRRLGQVRRRGLWDYFGRVSATRPRIFDLHKPIEFTLQALELTVGRPRHSWDHISHEMVWDSVVFHLGIVQQRMGEEFSELKELLEVFGAQDFDWFGNLSTRAAKVKKKRKPKTAPKVQTPRLVLAAIVPSHNVRDRDEEVLNDSTDLMEEHQSDQYKDEVPQSDSSFNNDPNEDQLTTKMRIISKYRKRGYGKCEDQSNSNCAQSTIHVRHWQIKDSEQYHSVWRIIFPQTRSDRQITRVSWPLFVEAMTAEPVGCRVKKVDGSMFVFERRNVEGGKEIFQCHAPHDMMWVPACDLYRYKKDLRDTFGMDSDRIVLVS